MTGLARVSGPAGMTPDASDRPRVMVSRHLPWLRHPVQAARTWWHLHWFHSHAVGQCHKHGVPVGVLAWVHDLAAAGKDGLGACPGNEPQVGHPENFPWRTPAEHALLALADTVETGADLAVIVAMLDWYQDPWRPAADMPHWVRANLPEPLTAQQAREANEGVADVDPRWILRRLQDALDADHQDGPPVIVERTDPASDYLGYLWAGRQHQAHHLVTHRVPLRLGLQMNPETFQAWRWRALTQATGGDPSLVEGLLPMADDPDVVWADIDDVVAWAREAGPERALLYARCGFTLEEGMACDADTDALRVMASLRGPVPYPESA